MRLEGIYVPEVLHSMGAISVSVDHAANVTETDIDVDMTQYDAGLLAYTNAGLTAQAKTQAQGALDKSDVAILRCFEHAVAVPETWQAYRAVLRGILSGTSTATELPTRPDYPAGT